MREGYEYVTYNTARFWVEEGMYSVEDIENLLVQMRKAKAAQDTVLTKEKANERTNTTQES
jgi:hypothetical protein